MFWPNQQEFVRMAARFGATIVPFGAVGEDDIAQVSSILYPLIYGVHSPFGSFSIRSFDRSRP